MNEATRMNTDTVTVEDVAVVAFRIAREIWGEDEIGRRFGDIGKQPEPPAKQPTNIPLKKPSHKESA